MSTRSLLGSLGCFPLGFLEESYWTCLEEVDVHVVSGCSKCHLHLDHEKNGFSMFFKDSSFIAISLKGGDLSKVRVFGHNESCAEKHIQSCCKANKQHEWPYI